MQRSVIFSSIFLLAAGLIQFACVQDFDQFDPSTAKGGSAGADVGSSSSSGSAGAGGGASSSSSSSASSSSSSSSSGGMPCMKSSDCPPDTACENWSCMMGMCGSVLTPSGTIVNDPMSGDCKANGCDGAGQTVTVNDDTDKPPGDMNPCTIEGCNNGMPEKVLATIGTGCGGGKKCDGMGNCVACVADADCTVGTQPTCVMGACISCSDGMMNGDETGVDCGGSCMKKCDGATCAGPMDCKSNFCADTICCNTACDTTCKSCNLAGTVGACTNIPLNGMDDAPVCNDMTVGGKSACDGAGACKLKVGEVCVNDGACVTGKCGTGNPKTCQP